MAQPTTQKGMFGMDLPTGAPEEDVYIDTEAWGEEDEDEQMALDLDGDGIIDEATNLISLSLTLAPTLALTLTLTQTLTIILI